jgi:hypothetical protein
VVCDAIQRRLTSLGMLVSRPHRAYLRLDLAGVATREGSRPSAKAQIEIRSVDLRRTDLRQEADLLLDRGLLREQIGDAGLSIRPARRRAQLGENREKAREKVQILPQPRRLAFNGGRGL